MLKEEPQNRKIRHPRGIDLPADMLTKPIVLPREWFKFWQFLGFELDMEGCPGLERKQSIAYLPPLFHRIVTVRW